MKKKRKQLPVKYKLQGTSNASDYLWERSLDLILSPGCYAVEIEHTGSDVGLPFDFCGQKHYIAATLIVTDNGTKGKVQKNRLTGQALVVTLQNSLETKIYIRTRVNAVWSEWRSLACTGMYNSISTTDELLATIESLVAENTRAKKVEEEIKRAAVDISSLACTTGNENLTVTGSSMDGQVISVEIPSATTERAGVMTAEDKKALDYVWESVLNLANRIDNNFISKTGVLTQTAKDISVFTIDGSLFKRIKAYVAADNAGASFIAFYNSETISAESLISNIVSTNTTTWVNADVPDGCKLIAVTSQNSILPEPQIYGITNAAKGVVDTREMVDVNTNTLKAFDPQQTLLCSNYLYTNAGTEGALSRIYYLWEQDNETIKGAFITGMVVNVLDKGKLSIYLTDNVEYDNRKETLIEEIPVTTLGVQVIRFSAPVVVGAGQTFGFKMGFKHAVSTTYGAKGFMGVRYVYNGVFSSSNKDFGFGLVGMKKYDKAEQYSITRGVLGSSLNRINPYYDHLFIDKINGEDVIIPSESIYSVAISKRLGFDVIELNVNSTSDGQFVVMHGDGGKFGKQFEHIDGLTDISTTAINSVTLAWMQGNVRYKSIYAKYRTAPSTLEDMLYECKRNGIVPFVQRKDINVNGTWISSISVAHRIMGSSNFISYGGGNMREYAAPIYHFGSESSIEAILAVCDKCGAPFIYGINNPSRFTDEELVEIVNKLHGKGYFVAFAGSYQNEPFNQKLLAMGFDMSASGWNVPIFTDSNIVCADSFEQFTHNGSVNDGVLTLNVGNTVSILHSGDVPFLSVGLLQIRFKGKLNIKMGDYINDELVSDGDSAMTLTTYYMEKAPVFTITATEETVVKDILFKASKR